MVRGQPQQALVNVDLARQTLPNSADLEQVASIINMRLGIGTRRFVTSERANVIEPHIAINLKTLAWVYAYARRYADEDRVLSELFGTPPANQRTGKRLRRAAIAMDARGDLEPLRRELKNVDSQRRRRPRVDRAGTRFTLAILSRDAAAADTVLKSMAPSMLESEDLPRGWFEGIVARLEETMPPRGPLSPARGPKWNRGWRVIPTNTPRSARSAHRRDVGAERGGRD